MLKYAELQQPEDPLNSPWSIRQFAVYQKFNLRTLESNHIFIRTPESAADCIYNALRSSTEEAWSFCSSYENIHLLCCSSVCENWGHYLNALDEDLTKLVCMVARDVRW
jgi:hypothetical protein